MGLIPDTLVGKDNTNSSVMKMTRFATFLFFLTEVVLFITAAPQKRAAMENEAVCASAAEAYSNAREEGKPAKRAAAISAKTFFEKVFDTFSDTGFPAGGLARCANTVDAAQARSTNGMVIYFNSAAKADLEVLTPVCRVATLAYLKAKVEASAAYLKAFDEYGDDGFACSKSQKFVPE